MHSPSNETWPTWANGDSGVVSFHTKLNRPTSDFLNRQQVNWISTSRITDGHEMAVMCQSTNRCGTVTFIISHRHLGTISAKPTTKHSFESKLDSPNHAQEKRSEKPRWAPQTISNQRSSHLTVRWRGDNHVKRHKRRMKSRAIQGSNSTGNNIGGKGTTDHVPFDSRLPSPIESSIPPAVRQIHEKERVVPKVRLLCQQIGDIHQITESQYGCRMSINTLTKAFEHPRTRLNSRLEKLLSREDTKEA
jgi:hypothetical protein